MRRFSIAAFTGTMMWCAAHAGAANYFQAPSLANGQWDRPAAGDIFNGSTYSEWDVFYQPNGLPNYADVASTPGTRATFADLSIYGSPHSGSAATAGTQAGSNSVRQTAGGAFIIGEGLPTSGNIYSFSNPTSFEVDIWNPGDSSKSSTTIWLQTYTSGSLLDLNSVKLVDPQGGADLAPFATDLLYTTPASSGFGGTDESRKFAWVVPGNASHYTLKFSSVESSMSLQYLAVDTQATPEPGLCGLAGGALVVLIRRPRKRGRNAGR